MKHCKTCFLLIFMCVVQVFAQYNETNWCATVTQEEKMLNEHPEVWAEREKLEQFTKEYEKANHKQSGSTYIIPIVFHVMHYYGDENIDKEQILDAVEILNIDFSKQNSDTANLVSDFVGIAANVGIKFRLATLDPYGDCTDGITRTATTLTFEADDDIKALVDWPSDSYLNVWVVDALESGSGGYSYYPGVSSAKDGIVLRHEQLGSIGTSSNSDLARGTLTHEVGHWLNLKHTWGNSNTPGESSNCSMDDDVSDTPLCIGTTSCSTTQVSCSSLDNVQNYMDYSGCYIMFTDGQKSRMLAALNSTTGDRDELWISSNLTATGTADNSSQELCTADFSYNEEWICVGNSVTFTDESWNGNPASWQWTFSGGTPSSSTDSMPEITYDTPGEYDVTLTVTNSTGSATETKSEIIKVSDTSADYGPTYSEDFENNTTFSDDWFVVNDDGIHGWERTTSASYSGSASLFADNYENIDNQSEEIISPSIDLSYIDNPYLVFKLAYAQYDDDIEDNLRVYISTNCGDSWSQRFNKSGSSLSTVSYTAPYDWDPGSASEWEEHKIAIPSSMQEENVRFKFQLLSEGGGNLYIDDIYIDGQINGIEEGSQEIMTMNVAPNPITLQGSINFTCQEYEYYSLTIVNILGKEEVLFKNKPFNPGNHSVNIPEIVSENGIYIAKLSVNGTIYSHPFVVNK